jgi:hypothetical protein
MRASARMDNTRRKLFECFDEDVHQRLRIRLADAKAQLDRVGLRFWALTQFVLNGRARFDDRAPAFDLITPPRPDLATGWYHLISKSQPEPGLDRSDEQGRYLYRLSHPLGELVVDTGKALVTPAADIAFDVSSHAPRVHVLEALRGKAGYLTLTQLKIQFYEREEYLLFSGFTDDGGSLDKETMEKLFSCSGRVKDAASLPDGAVNRLAADAQRHCQATISVSLEQNGAHFH